MNKNVKKGQIIVITGGNGGNTVGTITKVVNSKLKRGEAIDDHPRYEHVDQMNGETSILAEARTGSSISRSYGKTRVWEEEHFRSASTQEKKMYRKGIFETVE